MSDIFVSYAQEDRERVVPLVRALEESGWSVWWDPEGAAGAVLEEMVDREIEAAECMVVVWSVTSVRSDWVLGEADDGRERRILVPVNLDDVKPPRRFRQFNTVSLVSWDGGRDTDVFRRIVAGIQRHAGPLPEAIPAETVHPSAPAIEPERPDQKDVWDKIKIFANPVAAVLVLLTVIVVGGLWQFQGDRSDRDQVGTPAGVSPTQPTPSSQVGDEPPPVGYRPRSADVDAERQARIEELLDQAQRAFTEQRWTTPTGNNAYEYYREVLTLDPDQPQAQRGVERIFNRYMDLFALAMEDRQADKAASYLGHAEQVNPDAPALVDARARLQSLTAPQPPPPAENGNRATGRAR